MSGGASAAAAGATAMTGAAAGPAVRTDRPGPEYRRGVGIMLLNGEGRVFVAERIDTPGAWQMPQGGIDEGEDPKAAALRELAEETGIGKATILAQSASWLCYDLPPALRGTVWQGRYAGQAQIWFAMRFDGADKDIRIAGDHAEFSAWQWIAPERLPDLIVHFKRPLYEALLAEFAPAVSALTGR